MMRALLLVVLAAGCKSASKDAAPPAEKSDNKGGPGAVGGTPDLLAGSGSEQRDRERDADAGPLTQGRLAVIDLDGDFTAVGDIDKQTVKSTVKANMAKLRVCYEKTLLANPGIEGKCVCTFKVAIDGSVREAKASGVHPEVESCVADVVRSFKFPTSTAEVEVQYPFTFRAN
jgi:hypothetical protein